jgi:hypothetical protein
MRFVAHPMTARDPAPLAIATMSAVLAVAAGCFPVI